MARQPAFAKVPHRVCGDLPGADSIMELGLLWGVHPMMTDMEVDYVAESVLGLAART
jgi:dTDP-4-amino-4,6-dideoxygalactose transaminase